MIVRCIALSAVSALAYAATPSPAAALWNQLSQKRDALPGLHQEFEFSQTFRTAQAEQASKRTLIVDVSQGAWREQTISGSGAYIRVFNGHDLLATEDGSDEFVRIKRKAKDEAPLPAPYALPNADWSKAKEADRGVCKVLGTDHNCVVIDVPLGQRIVPGAPNTFPAMSTERVVADIETGVLVSARIVEQRYDGSTSYQSDRTYVLKRLTSGTIADATLLSLPTDNMHEVKELSRWSAARMKRQFSGKPAPELNVTDITGKPLSLADFHGKTVLLDFWTTWCPPCRADAPALDKLYKKYSDRDLMIVGISVSEDRPVVEKFLKEHPHSFPIVLTTENEMPRPYEVGAFPTYIVIEKDGTFSSAVEGDQGFSELKKVLRKAGLDVDQ